MVYTHRLNLLIGMRASLGRAFILLTKVGFAPANPTGGEVPFANLENFSTRPCGGFGANLCGNVEESD
jgi:hypothetical protein